MTIEVRVSQTVECSAAEAFAVLADMEQNPSWQKGMQSCVWTSEPPLILGSTYDQTASFLGREIKSSFEVTEFDDGRLIRIVSTEGMPIDVTREVVIVGPQSCEVKAVVRGDSSGVFRMAAPLMSQLVRRSVTADYRRLKALLEK